MSLAGIIGNVLEDEGVTFKQHGKVITTFDFIEIMKNDVIVRLLTPPQGGGNGEQYFCNRCADKIQEG